MTTCKTFPKIATEFPDYDTATLPAIPAGWAETSWRNDACPSFQIGDKAVVFVDYADVKQREVRSARRFNVLSIEDATLDHTLLSTDDWADVVALAKEICR